MVSIRTGYKSITGNFRENNEDNGVVDSEGRFYIVADGMGGQSAGEKASELAVELIPKKLTQVVNFSDKSADAVKAGIDEAVGHANAEIMALGEVDPDLHSMGTTVVFMVKVADRFFVGGVGDSRAYQLRGGELKQLTTDHSLTQALLEHGTITPEEAVNHKYRNVLYRYLGSKEGGSGTQSTEIKVVAGDRFLLCSDGVTDGIDDDVIKNILQTGDDPQAIVENLIKAAQDGGSKDNITALTLIVE